MEFYERVSGARMHANFYRPGLSRRAADKLLAVDIADFSINSLTTLNEVHTTLTTNKVWVSRLKNVGAYSQTEALLYGATGVMARCSGLKRDLRINVNTTYNDYFFLNFRSFISQEGDSYSRFLLRMYEIVESTNIINQCLRVFLVGSTQNLRFKNKLLDSCSYAENKMEDTIRHFKF